MEDAYKCVEYNQTTSLEFAANTRDRICVCRISRRWLQNMIQTQKCILTITSNSAESSVLPHQWPSSHLTEDFNHIKALIHGPCFTLPRAARAQESRAGPRVRGCARRHLYAVTGEPARQRFPGRELPSPMLIARQPDELPVSSNSPHSSHSAAPPGRSHCFTFHRVLLLYSALDAHLSAFPLAHGLHGTWQSA